MQTNGVGHYRGYGLPNTTGQTIFVVDDDEAVREAIQRLIKSIGNRVEACDSAESCLERWAVVRPSCLVLDVRLPGISGLEFQRRLRVKGDNIPIIFLTGHGDVPMSVQAMKGGAVEFLTKPFRDQELLDAIQIALERVRHAADHMSQLAVLKKSYATLTPREQSVMKMVAKGMINKQIATAMNLSEITVKVHRGHVMRKMGANSLADLIRIHDKLQP